MKPILKRTLTTVAVAVALAAAPLANATNGYFRIGYGAKNRGMGGAGMAFAQDSLAPAVNPAALAGVGNRFDGGVEIFNPQREGGLNATGLQTPDLDGPGPAPALSGTDQGAYSGATLFAVPNFGISEDMGGGLTMGLAVVANGGMNTRYNENLFTNALAPVIGQAGTLPPSPTLPPGPSGFAGLLSLPSPNGFNQPAATVDAVVAGLGMNPNLGPSLGVNLAQVLILPTIAYQVTSTQSIGFSPVIAYQRFRAYGLGLFTALSSDPKHVTNNGDDDAWGYGGRVGYQGTFFNGMFSLGASYTSQIYMEKFDNYSGLFAENGNFDVPSTYGAGLAIHPTSSLTIAADWSRINYSDVAAINNPGPTADEFFNSLAFALSNGGTAALPPPPLGPGPLTNARPLGTNNGYGFGWDDINVYKVGVNYRYSSKWTFRAGYNHADSPYDRDQTLFNILAPGLVEDHVTAGFTYSPTSSSELTVTYMHAFRNAEKYTYQGSAGSPFAGFSFKTQNAMSQNALEASYAWKF